MPPCTMGYLILNKSQRGVLSILASQVNSRPDRFLKTCQVLMKRLFGFLLLGFDLDNFNASISTTGWADLMGQSKFVALRTRDKPR